MRNAGGVAARPSLPGAETRHIHYVKRDATLFVVCEIGVATVLGPLGVVFQDHSVIVWGAPRYA